LEKASHPEGEKAEWIRVRGLVQGVGLRPAIWRLARGLGLRGSVSNDGQGVMIHVCGPVHALDDFALHLLDHAPPLARIEAIERESTSAWPEAREFSILASQCGPVRTGVVPDAATCTACRAEIFDPFARRFRYPFTNCTHCGPRLSIIEGVPYDRAQTTMRSFDPCTACAAEYRDPGDRRFHAQPIACHACGPHVWLERSDGAAIALDALTTLDAVDAGCTLLQRGHILAVKGLGGFQLACDACNGAAVARLRSWKRRESKPFALMFRDLEMVREYCHIGDTEEGLLAGSTSPIVILQAREPTSLAGAVAPGLHTLGVMLANTPLHHLMLRRMRRPIVLTSGNLASEPQCIDNEDARLRFREVADYLLLHDRTVARRVDDSVVMVAAGAARLVRRARGYAPAPMTLPDGFASSRPLLALGGELKNSFCLLQNGQAIISHHMGDLEDARSYADYVASIEQFRKLFEHKPTVVAVDLHPEYLSRKLGLELAQREDLVVAQVQHHHAHLAACLAENGRALNAPAILGIALDGLGFGADGSLWGGEFCRVDYRQCVRLATFRPVAMPGGTQAIMEPWRNTYAHLVAHMGWPSFAMNFNQTKIYQFLERCPRDLLDQMMAAGLNSPLASSSGRLFDAAAAAVGICTEEVAYEGQAAIEFEASVDAEILLEETDDLAYPFAIPRWRSNNLPYVEPLAMWQALLGDLVLGTPVGVIAARFHKGLAIVLIKMVEKLTRQHWGEDAPPGAVALSGGVFQNRVLLEQVIRRLQEQGHEVLTHRHVPANDGGLALGQAAVAAACALVG
jgi:hydrogenase maturation protein HypF